MDPQYTDQLLATVKSTASPDKLPGDPQSVLYLAYDAVVRGDFEAFAKLVTEDIQLSICGLPPMDGTWRGRDEVVAATRKNFAMVHTQQPEIESVMAQGDVVVVRLRENGVFKSDGRAYRVRCVQWFTFADGRIKTIDQIAASIGGG